MNTEKKCLNSVNLKRIVLDVVFFLLTYFQRTHHSWSSPHSTCTCAGRQSWFSVMEFMERHPHWHRTNVSRYKQLFWDLKYVIFNTLFYGVTCFLRSYSSTSQTVLKVLLKLFWLLSHVWLIYLNTNTKFESAWRMWYPSGCNLNSAFMPYSSVANLLNKMIKLIKVTVLLLSTDFWVNFSCWIQRVSPSLQGHAAVVAACSALEVKRCGPELLQLGAQSALTGNFK